MSTSDDDSLDEEWIVVMWETTRGPFHLQIVDSGPVEARVTAGPTSVMLSQDALDRLRSRRYGWSCQGNGFRLEGRVGTKQAAAAAAIEAATL